MLVKRTNVECVFLAAPPSIRNSSWQRNVWPNYYYGDRITAIAVAAYNGEAAAAAVVARVPSVLLSSLNVNFRVSCLSSPLCT